LLKSVDKICEIVTKNCYKNIFLLEKFVQLSFVNCKSKPLSTV